MTASSVGSTVIVNRRMLWRVARRDSDETALDIVMALLVGVPVGIAVALVVGGIGWLAGRDVGSFAAWLGVAVAVIAVGVALRRFERSGRRARDAQDAGGGETDPEPASR
jgi:small-conductance mechanosensitive channel